MTDDPLDFVNDLNKPPAARPGTGSKGRGKRFSTGLEAVTYKEAARATASKSMAGHYKRYTVYLDPEDIARLKTIAGEIGLSQAETARWFVEHMIRLYDEEELRPETEVAVVRRRLKRDKK